MFVFLFFQLLPFPAARRTRVTSSEWASFDAFRNQASLAAWLIAAHAQVPASLGRELPFFLLTIRRAPV